jgi:hypothetical protein
MAERKPFTFTKEAFEELFTDALNRTLPETGIENKTFIAVNHPGPVSKRPEDVGSLTKDYLDFSERDELYVRELRPQILDLMASIHAKGNPIGFYKPHLPRGLTYYANWTRENGLVIRTLANYEITRNSYVIRMDARPIFEPEELRWAMDLSPSERPSHVGATLRDPGKKD